MAKIVAIPAFVGLSAVLQGCGTGGLKSCSSPMPTGDDKKALEKMQWGYRVDASAALLYDKTKPLFKFCAEDVAQTKAPQTKMSVSSSSDVSETNNAVSTSVGVSGGIGAFSAAASMSYSQTSQSKFKSMRVDRKIKSKLYHVAVTTQQLYDRLTDENKDLLKSETPAKIVDTLGEFYATEASFGGLLMSTSIIEMTSEDDTSSIEASAQANFGPAGVSAGLKVNKANYKSNAKEYRSITILGGDQSIWAGVANATDISGAQAAWGKTIKGDDMYVVDTKLKPIWGLLEGQDDAKSKQIEDYLKNKWKADSVNITPYGDGFVPMDPSLCPAKFSQRQQKNYTGVKDGKFFCTTSAPTCTAWWGDCAGHEATPDHWSSNCDATESSCWTGNKVVCFKVTECCEGYELSANSCVKTADAPASPDVLI